MPEYSNMGYSNIPFRYSNIGYLIIGSEISADISPLTVSDSRMEHFKDVSCVQQLLHIKARRASFKRLDDKLHFRDVLERIWRTSVRLGRVFQRSSSRLDVPENC